MTNIESTENMAKVMFSHFQTKKSIMAHIFFFQFLGMKSMDYFMASGPEDDCSSIPEDVMHGDPKRDACESVSVFINQNKIQNK